MEKLSLDEKIIKSIGGKIIKIFKSYNLSAEQACIILSILSEAIKESKEVS